MAQWTAAGNFVLDDGSGLIQHWWKDWDKMQSEPITLCSNIYSELSTVWKQLGWVKPDNDVVEFA